MRSRLVLILSMLAAMLVPALPAAAACKLDLVVTMPVTMQGLSPVIDARIEGVDARLLVDLGAFFSSISRSRVDRYHLRVGALPSGITVSGVNGEADVGLATVSDFTLLGAPFHHTQFLVGGTEFGPTIDGILGRNFLMVADVELDLANGAVRMFQPHGCEGQPLAYWAAPGAPYSVVLLDEARGRTGPVIGTAKVNGVTMKVLFDSGASTSVLTLRAAGRAGIRHDGPGVTPAGLTNGFGRRSIETWIAPVDSFRIGDEEIEHTRLRIGAIDLGDVDMLIGADFMLSHRIYIARSQDKLYFTYNGGPVFRLDSAPAPPPVTEATAAAPPAPGAAVPAGDQPTDASGYARRGAAASARREYPQAIDDFTHAMALAPADPQLAYDRAMARLGNRQPLLAVSDLDQALKLKPDFTLALLGRGRLKLADRDPDGARADFEAAARIDPQLRLEIAQAYEAVGLMQPAVDNYDQWIAANPKDERLAFALNGRCWARALANHELQIALADCDRALKLRPSTAEFLDSRGLVRLRLGQYQQAIGDYDAALRLQPQIAWAHYGRGVAELKTGRAADGEADLKAADDISPVVVARARRLGIGPDAPAAGAATTAAPAAKP